MNKKYIREKKVYKKIIILMIIFIAIIMSIIIKKNSNITKVLNNKNMYNNVYINNIHIGEMSKKEAKEIILSSTKEENIIFIYNNNEYKLNKNELGLEYDYNSAIDEAYSIGRDGTERQRIKEIKSLEYNPYMIYVKKNIDNDAMNKILNNMQKKITKNPKDAIIKRENDKFVITKEINGIQMNIEKATLDIKEAIMQTGDIKVYIEIMPILAKVTESMLSKIQNILGSYSTNFSTKDIDSNRIKNVSVASAKIDKTLILPNEIFSTNEKFGKTNMENGYVPAPIILNGKFKNEYGGGVCQVSSTLYNSVLFSELSVLERANHSLKVGYIDYGYDATLAGDYIDFKFKNTTPYPIYIESYIKDNNIVCNIYGYDERAKNRKIKFESVLVDTVEPGIERIIKDNTLPIGYKKTITKSLKGYKYKLYKLIYIDDKLSEKVLINNSYYKPRPEEIVIGTKS